jgi:hypothetical protein
MRHIATLLAAVVIGPLAWVLIAFGQDRSVQIFATADRAGVLHGSDFTRPLLVLAAAGVLLGLIATLRVSPLGAVVTGTVYAASYLLLLAAPGTVLRLFRHSLSIAGRHADASTPIRTGTALVLGGLLLVAVFSAGRWRRWPSDGGESMADLWPEESGQTGGSGSWSGGLGLDPEPETQARYPSQPRRTTVGASGSSWAGSPHSGYGQ